ncbi:lipopolysaccharide biosynthesis protein [Vibrio chagasii]|uniref:lipopolysaccharide biosynthesis protein n=1 Tax=Vibrio chagasii TaxID=170679 RepID=UPI0038CD81C3
MSLNKLIKNTITYGLGVVASRGVALILLPIYTAYFSTERYGSIELITTLIQFLIVFGSLQIETAYQRYYYSEESKNNLMVSLCLVSVFSLCSSLLAMFFAEEISTYITGGIDKEVIKSIYLLFGLIMLTNVNTIIQIELRNSDRLIAFNVLTFIQVIVSAIYTIGALHYISVSIYHVFLGQLLGLIVYFLFSLRFFYSKLVSQLSFNVSTAREIFQYALPQVPARILSFANIYSNRVLVLIFLSSTEVGILSVAIKIASISMLIHQAFVMSWGPYVFKKDFTQKQTLREIENVFKYLLVAIAILVIIFTLLASPLQSILSSNEYEPATKLIAGFAFANVLLIVKEVVDIGPKVKNQTKYISYTYVIATLTSVASLIILLPIIGLVGAVVSSIFSNITLVVASWYYTEKMLDIKYNRMWFVGITFILSLALISQYLILGSHNY